MSHIAFGILAGVLFGALSVGVMLPHSFPDKRAALTAAFLSRFAIGFTISVVALPWPSWVVGLCFGILISAPDAVTTKRWAPILGIGSVGGLVIGLILPHVAR